MATPTSSDSSPVAHIGKTLWDKLYKEQKDQWTRTSVDQELFKFHDILANGKTGLDILVPMCGKTSVLLLLAKKGHRVTGIEWSELSIKQFFEMNGLGYTTKSCNIGDTEMTVYTANDKSITIYSGDIFAFKDDNLGGFDCIFDHGSIGSFEPTKVKRTTYAQLISSFTKPGGRVLLSFFDYDHSEHPTYPFAITEDEVTTLYIDDFNSPKLLDEIDATKAVDLFGQRERQDVSFPIWTLNRFSWKIVLLTKKVV